jgi:hypothetical protein
MWNKVIIFKGFYHAFSLFFFFNYSINVLIFVIYMCDKIDWTCIFKFLVDIKTLLVKT